MKKALIIGINYTGSQNQLRGCINDACTIANLLLANGYSQNDMVVLRDDMGGMDAPTRNNILRAMQWLVQGVQPGDSLFFHYSGHGGKVKDLDGDEDDGFDECIYPVDFQIAGPIIDDILHDIMVKPLPPNSYLTALFDCCHSGSMLDLPFMYRATDGGLKEYSVLKTAAPATMELFMGYTTRNTGQLIEGAKSLFNTATNYKSTSKRERIKQMKSSPANVISISGCRDDQTSADAQMSNQFAGAMTYAFNMTIISARQQLTLLTLIQNMRAHLSGKYSQKCQLSTAHQIDPNTPFFF